MIWRAAGAKAVALSAEQADGLDWPGVDRHARAGPADAAVRCTWTLSGEDAAALELLHDNAINMNIHESIASYIELRAKLR